MSPAFEPSNLDTRGPLELKPVYFCCPIASRPPSSRDKRTAASSRVFPPMSRRRPARKWKAPAGNGAICKSFNSVSLSVRPAMRPRLALCRRRAKRLRAYCMPRKCSRCVSGLPNDGFSPRARRRSIGTVIETIFMSDVAETIHKVATTSMTNG